MLGILHFFEGTFADTAEPIPAGLPPAALLRIQRSLHQVDLVAISTVALRYYVFTARVLDHPDDEAPEPEQEPEPYGPHLFHHG